jgi:hypothetical protein
MFFFGVVSPPLGIHSIPFVMMRDIKENYNSDDVSRVGYQITELINMREHGDGLLNGDEIEQRSFMYQMSALSLEVSKYM